MRKAKRENKKCRLRRRRRRRCHLKGESNPKRGRRCLFPDGGKRKENTRTEEEGRKLLCHFSSCRQIPPSPPRGSLSNFISPNKEGRRRRRSAPAISLSVKREKFPHFLAGRNMLRKLMRDSSSRVSHVAGAIKETFMRCGPKQPITRPISHFRREEKNGETAFPITILPYKVVCNFSKRRFSSGFLIHAM